MDILSSPEFLHFVLRWLHFIVGITWIGMLYYFNFVQTPFFKSCDGGVRSGMIRGLVPKALWYFRWGAMFTFITGLGMIHLKGSAGAAYDGPYMTMILTGGLMGTFMWFNVWFVIWPAQKLVIASAEQVAAGGEAIPEAAARGAKAGMASRTNTLLSFPMLFFMGAASHLTVSTEAGVMNYWIAAAVLTLLIEINGVVLKPGSPSQKMLTSVPGVIHAGLLVTVIYVVLIEYLL